MEIAENSAKPLLIISIGQLAPVENLRVSLWKIPVICGKHFLSSARPQETLNHLHKISTRLLPNESEREQQNAGVFRGTSLGLVALTIRRIATAA